MPAGRRCRALCPAHPLHPRQGVRRLWSRRKAFTEPEGAYFLQFLAATELFEAATMFASVYQQFAESPLTRPALLYVSALWVAQSLTAVALLVRLTDMSRRYLLTLLRLDVILDCAFCLVPLLAFFDGLTQLAALGSGDLAAGSDVVQLWPLAAVVRWSFLISSPLQLLARLTPLSGLSTRSKHIRRLRELDPAWAPHPPQRSLLWRGAAAALAVFVCVAIAGFGVSLQEACDHPLAQHCTVFVHRIFGRGCACFSLGPLPAQELLNGTSPFEGLGELRVLDWSSANVTRLPPHVFAPLDRLKIL